MRRIKHAAAGLIFASLLHAGPSPAQSHSMLTASNPAEGTAVDAPPERLELTFQHPVHLTMVTMTTLVGESIPVEMTAHTGEPTARYTLPLPALQPEEYTVEWRAMGDDGHVMSDSFTFSVAGN